MYLVSLDKFASFKQMQESFTGLNLSLVRTELMRKSEERLYAAIVCVKGYGTDIVSPFGQAFAFQDAPYCMCAHELCAVEQRQTFFGLEGDGLPSEFGCHFGTWTDLSFLEDFSQSEQRKGQMRQRSEVSGSTQRAMLIHHREDVIVEHVNEPLYCDQLGS